MLVSFCEPQVTLKDDAYCQNGVLCVFIRKCLNNVLEIISVMGLALFYYRMPFFPSFFCFVFFLMKSLGPLKKLGRKLKSELRLSHVTLSA